jgi:4-amino-4-deoxychorismate lyase
MSQFIESIKVEDQEIFLLELHQKRVNQTFPISERRFY